MAFDRHWHVAVPPETVFAALRENTREWRESVIPRDVWASGVLQVIGEYSPPRFRLRYDRRWQRSRGGDPMELRGEVVRGANGGADIHVRCGLTAGIWVAPVVLMAIGTAMLWSSIAEASLFWGIAVLMGGWQQVRDSRVTAGSDREADYLVARVEQALAGVAKGTTAIAPAG
jgi:hypothetical protein